MNSLKLNRYVYEKLEIELPKFPSAKKREFHAKVKLRAATTLYFNKRDSDLFAVRLGLTYRLTRKGSKVPEISLEAAIVGMFARLERKKQIRSLVKTDAAPMLYEILLQETSKILSHTMIKGSSLPPRLK